MKQNLYQVLGVPQNASQNVLDASYKGLLTKYQALHNQGAQDTSNERVILKWAYEHLSNGEKRAAYDLKLKPHIVHPIPKVSSQPTKISQQENDEAQVDSSLFAAQKANGNTVGFFMGNIGPTEPVKFGLDMVIGALESTKEDVKKITDDLTRISGSKSNVINQSLLEHDEILRLILTASQSAAFFLYLIHKGISEDVLQQVIAGIYKGFATISQFFPEPMPSKINDYLVMQFQIYLKSLDEEIKTPEENYNHFNSGKTATLVTDRIAKECGIDGLFQINNTGAMEKSMLEKHVACSGIIYILKVCPALKITYRS